MLKPKDLASVVTRLQVPLIVSDILGGAEEMTDVTEYALHESISDMQPDSALLAIALCGMKIAKEGMPSAACAVLDIECHRVMEDYALLWLRNAEADEINEEEALEMLSRTEEDLEDLAGLLDSCMGGLERTNKTAAMLCNIMRVQARAQALVAQAYFDAMREDMEPFIAEQVLASNVIPFPKRG